MHMCSPSTSTAALTKGNTGTELQDRGSGLGGIEAEVGSYPAGRYILVLRLKLQNESRQGE